MNGIILYEGPSLIDQEPIVAIATGLVIGATNKKTGPMVQIYIMRSDMNPLRAVETGDDRSICGHCRHRGRIVEENGVRRNVERSCYVTVMHGPRAVYASHLRGSYRSVPPSVARKLLTGRLVRLGAYGDPAAVPVKVWDEVLAKSKSTTGYTHLWREHPELSNWCMASCDSDTERIEAKALGFRTFRVRTRNDPVLKGEGICPASIETSVQCASCLLCGGNRHPAKADIAIEVHGRGVKHFKEVA